MKIFNKIRAWGEDRNLIEGSDPKSQFTKLMEEAGELASSINKGKSPEDDIGDMVVVLTLLASQHGLRIEDCIKTAYNDIKDRKGYMIDGVFVKESDLTE